MSPGRDASYACRNCFHSLSIYLAAELGRELVCESLGLQKKSLDGVGEEEVSPTSEYCTSCTSKLNQVTTETYVFSCFVAFALCLVGLRTEGIFL